MKLSDQPDPMAADELIKMLNMGVGPAAQKPKRERNEYEKRWPDNVWTIGLSRIDLLGVDEDGNLYWDGKRLEVRQRLMLNFWQNMGAIIVTASAFVAAAAATVQAYAAIKALPAPVSHEQAKPPKPIPTATLQITRPTAPPQNDKNPQRPREGQPGA